MKNLKELIFAAESVAHLQGYEREILPLTDKVREMYKLMKDLNSYWVVSANGIYDKDVDIITDKIEKFIEANPLDITDDD